MPYTVPNQGQLPINNDLGALITAVAATVAQASTVQNTPAGKGLIVVLRMQTVGTGSVTLTISGVDNLTGQIYTLLAGAVVTTNSVNVYTVYPAAPASANVSANSPVPQYWQVATTANNANPTTFTVSAVSIA